MRGGVPSFLGYKGTYPAMICASVNDEIVHGIPSANAGAEGGRGAVPGLRRHLGGLPRRFGGHGLRRGQPPSDGGRRLVGPPRRRCTPASPRPGPAPGSPTSAHAVRSRGLPRAEDHPRVRRPRHRQGDARGPLHPELRPPGRGPELRPGLVSRSNPWWSWAPTHPVLDDDWTVVTADGSLAAHFEHTIAVTEDGREILTSRTG